MKNFLLFLSVVFAGIFMSCNHTPPNPPSCHDFNADCELMKPWAAVKITNFVDTGAIDAYGEKLTVGSWYIRSSQTALFFPLPNGRRVSFGEMWIENLLKGEDDLGILHKTDVKLDTVRIVVGQWENSKVFDVAVFCMKNGQVDYFCANRKNGFESSFDFSFYKKE